MRTQMAEKIIEILPDYLGIFILNIIMINVADMLIKAARMDNQEDTLNKKAYMELSTLYFCVLSAVDIIIINLELTVWLFVPVIIAGISAYAYMAGKLGIKQTLKTGCISGVIIIIALFLMEINKYNKTMYTVLFTACISFVEYIIISLFMSRRIEKLNRQEMMMLIGNIVLSAIIIYVLIGLDNSTHRYAGIICVLINCSLVYALIRKMKSAQTSEREYIKAINDYKLQEQYMQSVYAMDEHTRRLRHDMKNHINTISCLLDEENGLDKAKEYLKQYRQHTSLMQDIVHTDSSVVNAVINEKLLYCREHGINTSVSVDMNISRLSDVELCSVLGNILDNAIEAEMKLDETDRDIRISVLMKEDVLDISVQNRIYESVLAKHPDLKTTKEDTSNHGLGIGNVRKIVDKHDGYMDICENGEYFCINIRI